APAAGVPLGPAVRARTVVAAGPGVALELAARLRRRGLLLLLGAPQPAPLQPALGRAPAAPFQRGLQPLHRPAQGRLPDRLRLALLPAAGAARPAAAAVPDPARRAAGVPVLDSFAAYRPARLPRVVHGHAEQPPRAPRPERPLHRQEPRRRVHRLGPPVRHLRRR